MQITAPDHQRHLDVLRPPLVMNDFGNNDSNSEIPALLLMNHAAIIGLPDYRREAEWEKTAPSVKQLGEYVLGVMSQRPTIEIFSSFTERTSTTAKKVAEMLLKQFPVEVIKNWEWHHGVRERLEPLPEEIDQIVESSRLTDRQTMFVGHEDSAFYFGSHTYLEHYAQIVRIGQGEDLEIAPGYYINFQDAA